MVPKEGPTMAPRSPPAAHRAGETFKRLHRLAFSGAVSSTSASPSVSPVSFICSPHLSFANHERQAAQSPEHEGRSREAGFFTHVSSLPFLLTGWPHDPV